MPKWTAITAPGSSSPVRGAWKTLPDPSGGDDLAALNAFLATGGSIRTVADATYKVSAPPVVRSDTILDLRGATIKFADAAVRDNMLVNAACIPVATATDAATVIHTSVVTSPALAGQAHVGQVLAVEGAGPPGGNGGGPIWLYGQVTAVDVNANTITLGGNVNGVRAHVSLTNATAHLFNRDKNIEIIGGTFDAEDNWALQADRIAAGFKSYQIRLRRVDGLKVHGQKLTMVPWTGGLGWANGIGFGDCTDFLIEDIGSDSASTTASGDGPLTRGVIRNMHGLTQDDMVPLGCVGFQGNDMEGDITDVEVDGIFSNNSWSAFKANAGTGSDGAQRYLRTSVRGVKGTTQGHSIQVIDYAGAGTGFVNVLIEDTPVKPTAGKQAIVNTAVNGRVSQGSGLRWEPRDGGYLAATCDPGDAGGSLALATGAIYVFQFKVPAAILATNLHLWVKTAGAGLVANQCWAAIIDPQGNTRLKSGDLSGVLNTAAIRVIPLTPQGAYSATLEGGPGMWYWLALLSNGTTAPAVAAQVADAVWFNTGWGAGRYLTSVPGAKHRIGFLSTTSRTSIPASIAGENIDDNSFKSLVWGGIV